MFCCVKNGKSNELVRLSVTLLIIAASVALLLSTVNYFTAPRIAEMEAEKQKSALLAVMPKAIDFKDSMNAVSELWDASVPLKAVYTATDKNGAAIGYCIEVTPKGYSAAIDMVVGVNIEGKISGVEIISMADTPGIGTKIEDKSFLKQFVGKSGTIRPIKNGTAGAQDVLLISGATYSSGGFTDGVNAALQIFELLEGEGADEE